MFVEDEKKNLHLQEQASYSALAFGALHCIYDDIFYTPHSYPCFLFLTVTLVSTDDSCDSIIVMFSFEVQPRSPRFVCHLYPVAIVRIRKCVRACVCIGATVKLKQQF